MSNSPFPLMCLPPELRDLIFSFLDYPNLITTLTVNKHIHDLASNQDLLRDPEIRIQFLLAQENLASNANPPGTLTFPDDTWRWPNHSPKKSYICFFCKKLKPLRKFAHGQCFRMMINDDYSNERRRFCLECGVKDLEPQGAGILVPGGRKYYPGAMINSVDYGFRVHLCGGCGEWSPDFFCIRDKLCFQCTEKDLNEPEKFVEGYREGPRELSSEIDRTEDDEALKLCGVFEELLARFREDEISWPRRPPCCRRCGGIWRFHPDGFGWRYGLEKKRPSVWRHGYKISGRALQEITHRGQPYLAVPEDYMSWFCPFPNQSWRSRLEYNLYKDIWDKLKQEIKLLPANEVLD